MQTFRVLVWHRSKAERREQMTPKSSWSLNKTVLFPDTYEDCSLDQFEDGPGGSLIFRLGRGMEYCSLFWNIMIVLGDQIDLAGMYQKTSRFSPVDLSVVVEEKEGCHLADKGCDCGPTEMKACINS